MRKTDLPAPGGLRRKPPLVFNGQKQRETCIRQRDRGRSFVICNADGWWSVSRHGSFSV